MPSTSGRGLTLAILSAATFGTSGSLAASLLDVGWTPGAAVTARLGLAVLVLGVPALLQLRGRWQQLRRGSTSVLVYGLAAVAGAQLCFFNAVAHVSVGVALLMEYSGALLVVAWLWARHGQRPRRLTITGAALAVVGMVLVLDLAGDHRVALPGLLWGMGAAVGLAVYYLLSADVDDVLPPLAMVTGGLVVGVVVLLGAGALGLVPLRAPLVPVDLFGVRVGWLVPVLGLSLVAAVVAYVSGVSAARVLGARVSSFVGLTEVLFAVLFAWLLLGQVPVPVQLVGGLVVVAGIALVRLDDVPAQAREGERASL